MYAIYDMKDNETCIAIFDKAKEVATYFGKTKGTVFSTITRRNLVKHRYRIVKIDDDLEEEQEESNPYCFNELIKEFLPQKNNFILFSWLKDETKRKKDITINNEQWKPIKDFNYSISNYGRVKNNTTNKFKELRVGKYGYQINLWNKSKAKMFTLSRLVANYFIREVQENERVIHIDGDIRNNYFKNLKIVNK